MSALWRFPWKTVAAAMGFLIVAYYHAQHGQADQAWDELLAALGLMGLRHAAAKKQQPQGWIELPADGKPPGPPAEDESAGRFTAMVAVAGMIVIGLLVLVAMRRG